MHKVVERKRIVPNIHLLRVEAPDVVRKVVPGNFVILKIDEIGERIREADVLLIAGGHVGFLYNRLWLFDVLDLDLEAVVLQGDDRLEIELRGDSEDEILAGEGE